MRTTMHNVGRSMTRSLRAGSPCPHRGLLSALLAVLLLFFGELKAVAFPKDPPPRQTHLGRATGPPLVARARGERYKRGHRAKKKLKSKSEPKSEPAAEGAEEGAPPSGPTAGPTGPEALQRSGRIEFDGRLVQGQTAKSGAIYLFARQRTNLKSMVRERKDFRKEILRTVDPNWVVAP